MTIKVGDVFTAVHRIRVGLHGGPERDGLCNRGDKFLVVGVTDDEVALLYLWAAKPYIVYHPPEVCSKALGRVWNAMLNGDHYATMPEKVKTT